MSLTIAEVLEHYDPGIKLPHRQGFAPVRCPFRDNHSRGDRVMSASVSLGKDYFRCHACDAHGGPIGLIMHREGLDYIGAIAYAQAVFGEGVVGVSPATRREPRKREPSRWREKLLL